MSINTDKAKEASQSDDILKRPIMDSMALWQTSHATIKEARELAKKRIIAEEGMDGMRRIEREIETEKLVVSINRTEETHPGLIAELIKTGNAAHVARRFDLTRQRVSVIYGKLKTLCACNRWSLADVVRRLENGHL